MTPVSQRYINATIAIRGIAKIINEDTKDARDLFFKENFIKALKELNEVVQNEKV